MPMMSFFLIWKLWKLWKFTQLCTYYLGKFCLLLLVGLSVWVLIFWNSVIWCIKFRAGMPFHHYGMALFIYGNIHSEIYFAWYINPVFIRQSVFFFLISVIVIYLFPSVSFNLFASLYLKFVSCRQHIVGSWYVILSNSLCFFIECLDDLHLMGLLIGCVLNYHLVIFFYFSLFIPLFLFLAFFGII